MDSGEGGFDGRAGGEVIGGVVEATEEDDFPAGGAEGAEGVVALGDVVQGCGGCEGAEEEGLGVQEVLGGGVYSCALDEGGEGGG